MAKKKQKKHKGRLVGGRIDWKNTENLLPIHIAITEYPFHARVFADRYDMSTSAVYYRLRQHGISLSALRNGLGGKGKEVLDRYKAKNLTVAVVRGMSKTHNQHYKVKVKK